MTKVMIVDDEPDIREMLSLFLKNEDFDTKTAVNGDDFLDKIDEFNPDIVTLDVMMPGLKTTEILEKLKEKQSNSKIILLTVVRLSDEEKEKISNMGNIIDYITKPFDLDNLMDSVKKNMKIEKYL